jgi:hypothetical protein
MSFIFGILILPIINGENCAEKSLPGMQMEVEMLFTLITTVPSQPNFIKQTTSSA